MRHREMLQHRELVSAYTTAEVVNSSLNAPKKRVSPLLYMPSYSGVHKDRPVELTEEQQEAKDIYMGRVYELAAKLRAMRNAKR